MITEENLLSVMPESQDDFLSVDKIAVGMLGNKVSAEELKEVETLIDSMVQSGKLLWMLGQDEYARNTNN